MNTATVLLKESWPLILSGLVISVYMKIDQVMIKHLIDDNAVGIYAAAVKVSEIWYFIPVVIASSLFPAIINSRKINEVLYETNSKILCTDILFGCLNNFTLLIFQNG